MHRHFEAAPILVKYLSLSLHWADVANPSNIAPARNKSIEFGKSLWITNASLDFSRSSFAHLARNTIMQTRSRTSRRNKVTVLWLPVELIIEIFRRVQKLIGRRDFIYWSGETSMTLDQEYCNNLLAFAWSIKEWTAIAQAELFRDIILKNRSKTGQFLKLVRERKEFRRYADSATSIRFGEPTPGDYEVEGLGDDLDEIALYCPNLVDVTCWRVDVRLEYFRNMIKLEKLKLSYGSILPPSTSEAPPQTITIPITLLSLRYNTIPSPIDPSSLPLIRSLHLSYQMCQPIRQLLPQLDLLHVGHTIQILGINPLIQGSTSITSLALVETLMSGLNDASKTVIQERVVEFRVQVSKYGASSDSALAIIIDGSKVMKKVILDGIHLGREDETGFIFLQTLRFTKAACKKKKIELWKENFDVGNGKVDLEK